MHRAKSDLIGITVNQHIALEQKRVGSRATGSLSNLLTEIIVASKVIRNRVALAGIADVLGSAGTVNIQGETQQLLDCISHNVMTKRLLSSGEVSMIISEEGDDFLCPDDKLRGDYALAIDPLDGSSNISCNIPIGTIFGIWHVPKSVKKVGLELFKGCNQVVAGYVLYGPSCMLVYTSGHGVNGFTFDPSIGEFILSHPNLTYPLVSKCYSINEAYYNKWDKPVQDIVNWIKTPDNANHPPYTGRYVGSLVADFHRNLLYGGIFMYPTDKDNIRGKLRLLYEAAPLSFIAEQAGGLGSDGFKNILDIVPTSIHERVPLFIGNVSDVLVCQSFLSKKYIQDESVSVSKCLISETQKKTNVIVSAQQ